MLLEDGDAEELGFFGAEGVLGVGLAGVGGAVVRDGPGFAVEGGFNFILIPLVSFFPGDFGRGDGGGLFEFELKPVGHGGAVAGPTSCEVSIDGFPREVAGVGLDVLRGDLDRSGVLGWICEGGIQFFGLLFHFLDEIRTGVGSEEVVVELTAGPKEAASDEVEVAWVLNGVVVVTNGGGKGGSALLGVDPGNDGGTLLSIDVLMAEGEGLGVEDLCVVVELFLFSDPIGERFGDGMVGIGELDGDGFLRAVASGMKAEVLGPLIGAISKRVHGAVKVDGGNGLMDCEDVLHRGEVLIRGSAFVVNDHVVSLGPIGVVIKWERGIGAAVVGPDDINADVGAFLDALVEDLVLCLVIVAAAAGDEEGFEGKGFFSCLGFRLEEEERGEEDQ